MPVTRLLCAALLGLGALPFACSADLSVEGSVPVLSSTELRSFSDQGREWGKSLRSTDLDGDGAPEVILGCPSVQPEQPGLVVVLSGVDLSIAAVLLPDARLAEGRDLSRFGESLAAADFDGDGQVDLAVGAPSPQDLGLSDAGQVWMFAGPVGEQVPQVRSAPQPRTQGRFGAVLEAADLDGDGRQDLLVGEPGAGVTQQARVWVLEGLELQTRRKIDARDSGSGFGSEIEVLMQGSDGPSLIIGAPAASDGQGRRHGVAYLLESDPGLEQAYQRLVPTGEGGRFAASVAQGDFDGDGQIEVVVSAFEGEPALYVFRSSQWDSPERRALDPGMAPGPGASLYALPDVTGDGLDELMILGERETWLMGGGRLERPLARLPYPADGVAASDVDGDGGSELWLSTAGTRREDGISVLRLVDFGLVEVGE